MVTEEQPGRTDHGDEGETTVVSATVVVHAPAETIFEEIADPSRQPAWDGNDNLASADEGQRVQTVGDVFVTVLTHDGAVRHNHVVELEEGRLIAWRPSEPGSQPPGHLWRWELRPLEDGDATEVTHTYDWTELRDPGRLRRARATTPAALRASIDRLAALVEAHASG